jgi:hypothetical protein
MRAIFASLRAHLKGAAVTGVSLRLSQSPRGPPRRRCAGDARLRQHANQSGDGFARSSRLSRQGKKRLAPCRTAEKLAAAAQPRTFPGGLGGETAKAIDNDNMPFDVRRRHAA